MKIPLGLAAKVWNNCKARVMVSAEAYASIFDNLRYLTSQIGKHLSVGMAARRMMAKPCRRYRFHRLPDPEHTGWKNEV
jgi:hypothetical protein